MTGSSPLTRGKPRSSPHRHTTGGLIPAHAGKTSVAPTEPCRASAHPRSRGENEVVIALVRSGAGSSPLTRGKHPRIHQRNQFDGLIPAHAGKTGALPSTASPGGAHPRSRGENTNLPRTERGAGGSSPRGRGKRSRRRHRRQLHRLIPAWAGKTATRRRPRSSRTAHPRVGGENSRSSRMFVLWSGSSPRGRGKHPHDRRLRREPGLIPAWAGKTARLTFSPSGAWAHPRVGGENSRSSRARISPGGSSPRGRGKLAVGARRRPMLRLIPAWAGKTQSPQNSAYPRTAHPRVGGENSSRRLKT